MDLYKTKREVFQLTPMYFSRFTYSCTYDYYICELYIQNSFPSNIVEDSSVKAN